MLWTPTLFTFLVVLNYGQSAKILGVFHMTARSHYILGSSLMRALAERGHDVTVISPFGEQHPPKNGTYRDIKLTGFEEEHDKKMKELNVFGKRKMHPLIMAPLMPKIIAEMTEKTLNHTNVQKLIHSDETFDVVIIEEFANHALKALATHFKGHLVMLSTMGANTWVNTLVGNPTPLSYVPNFLLGYSNHMTFSERLINTLSYIVGELVNCVFTLPKHDQLIKHYIPDGPNIEEVMHNVSLILLNSHPSTNFPVPYVPQMVDIGGFHLTPPKKLPKDLQQYLDNAKNGVIYFSLGSSAKSSFLPEETRQLFINVFSKLKEDVLWKWEDDILPGKPTNVRVAKWLPQQDILAHPNVKLFITHAGLLSTIETIYHGMSVLAIPLGGDQKLNAQQIVNQGLGLQVPFQDLSEELLGEKINKLLTSSTYRNNARARSQFFHDRLVSPLDTAIYWIEYVIRHDGTSHLRVAGLDLPWYQYFLLDVIAALGMAGMVIPFVSCKIVKVVLGLCSKKNKPKLKQQ